MKALRRSAIAAVALAAALTLSACGSDDMDTAAETTTEQATAGTIVDVAVGNPDFSTLVAALTAADLVTTLQGAGPFTVFAPTNQAFTDLLAQLGVTSLSQVSVATLRQVLRHHVVAGARVFSNDVAPGNVATASGTSATIAISGGNATIKGSGPTSATATIVATDIMARNGVVHLINKVILP
mgnify:CR=1 FL=1